MNIQKAAKWFGIIILVVGILGFVPGLTPDGHLLGIFHVDTIHNIIHILTGIVALLSTGSDGAARGFFKLFGIVYGLVTIIGFVQGTTVLGIFGINMADNVLHLLITALSLYFGFTGPKAMQSGSAM